MNIYEVEVLHKIVQKGAPVILYSLRSPPLPSPPLSETVLVPDFSRPLNFLPGSEQAEYFCASSDS